MRTPNIKLINATIEACNAAKRFTTPQILSELSARGITVSYDHLNVTFRRWLEAGKISRIKHGYKHSPAVYSMGAPLRARREKKPEPEPQLSPTELAWRQFRSEMNLTETQ